MANTSNQINAESIDESFRKKLSALLNTMIPPDDQLRAPGAGDDAIVLQVIRSLRAASLQRIADGIEEIENSTIHELKQPFSDLAQVEREHWFHKHDLARHDIIRILGSITLQCYYCDLRVLESLGAEPRPPFPKGFKVEQGDLSLLAPVRKRGRMYRGAS